MAGGGGGHVGGAGADADAVTAREADGTLLFAPRAAAETKAQMRAMRFGLLRAVEATSSAGARILFDLRACDLSFRHLTFTLRTLATYEGYIRARVDRSAAIIPHNRAAKLLCDLFLRAYTPVRPFAVFLDEEGAREFLRRGRDTRGAEGGVTH